MVKIWKNVAGRKIRVLGQGVTIENAILEALENETIKIYDFDDSDIGLVEDYIRGAKSDYIIEETKISGDIVGSHLIGITGAKNIDQAIKMVKNEFYESHDKEIKQFGKFTAFKWFITGLPFDNSIFYDRDVTAFLELAGEEPKKGEELKQYSNIIFNYIFNGW